jgi:hypothetical protein
VKRAGASLHLDAVFSTCLHHSAPERSPRLHESARRSEFCHLLTRHQCVDACKRGNLSVFAVAARIALKVLTLTLERSAALCSYPIGDGVSQRQQPVRKHRVLLRAVPTNLEEHNVDRTTPARCSG